MEDRDENSKIVYTKFVEYDELMTFVKSKTYVPNLNVFSGGGNNYSLTVVKDLGIIVFSVIDEKVTYISEYGGKIRKSSGYMLFAILKTHLNRYIFADGLIPIHGAVLGMKSSNGIYAVVIIGESGAGKSTLCYRVYNDLHYDIYGDDLIVYNPAENKIYGYCKEIFLKEDIILKYGVEGNCEKRNGKYALPLQNASIAKTGNYTVIYLKREEGFAKIEPDQLSEYFKCDIKNWCKSKNEEKTYTSVELFLKNARNIFSGSYYDTEKILEAI